MSRPDCTWRARPTSTSFIWVWAIRWGYLPGKFGWIRAANEQVTGVQAQGDRGALEHPLHLVAVLDHGSDVRMEHRAHTVLGGNGIDPVQVGQQGGPTRSSKVGRLS